jgi:large subunit ribosomal protein L2
MPVKKFNPITPGTRFRIGNAYTEVTTDSPEKSLLAKTEKSGGRNNQGRRTMRQIGGGHKKRFRIIDFKRDKNQIPATVKSIEYDPNRTAFIALLAYVDGEKRYILAPHGLKVGDTVLSGSSVAPDKGNCMPIGEMPLGTTIHAIETKPGQGAVLVRSAGSSAQLLGKDGKYVILKMPSGETRMILALCRATVGSVSNPDHGLQVLGKAGRKRWLGRRPRVRGVAMNPVDHPMGGGEGRSSGGHPRSRNGLKAKGQKTRKSKQYSNKFIITRRKTGKNSK